MQLEIRHTPGHTPESISIVVCEHADDDVPYGVLTGDALFIGDVGRPDLLASLGFTRDELADQLYDSLHDKLLTLPDATRVYPAHGAGSACGKNLSTETWSTIGDQRVEQLRAARARQGDLRRSRHRGPAARAVVLRLRRRAQPQGSAAARRDGSPLDALDLDEATRLVDAGAMLLDGRTPEEFARGHLVGSVNVGLEGRYAEFAGSVVPSDVDIVLVVEPGFELEARNRLGRIGFDRVVGYLDDPLAVMAEHPERTPAGVAARPCPSSSTVASTIGGLQIVDIRNPGEVAIGSIAGAMAIPVGQLPGRVDELDPDAADGRVLRRRVPIVGRGQPAALEPASPTCPTSSAATAPGSSSPDRPAR